MRERDHQKHWSPKSLFTENIVHQKHCSPKTLVTKNIVHQKHGSPKKWLQKVIVLPGTGEYIQIGCQGPVREEKETNSAAQGSFVCRQKTPFLENTKTQTLLSFAR